MTTLAQAHADRVGSLLAAHQTLLYAAQAITEASAMTSVHVSSTKIESAERSIRRCLVDLEEARSELRKGADLAQVNPV